MPETGDKTLLDFLYHISPALVAVALGGLLVNRFFVRKANLGALVDRVCNSLDGLRDDCASYWTQDFTDAKKTDLDVLEAKIKGSVLHINTIVHLIEEKYGNVPPAMCERILELQDACTGGDFESRKRKADKIRFMRIAACINKLTAHLQRLKI